MNALTLSTLSLVVVICVAAVGVRGLFSRKIGSVLSLVAGASFAASGFLILSPLFSLMGLLLLGCALAIVLQSVPQRTMVMGVFFAVSLPTGIFVADAWGAPEERGVGFEAQLHGLQQRIADRGGREEVRLLLASDTASAALGGLFDQARNRRVDAIVLIDSSKAAPPIRRQYLKWLAESKGVPAVLLDGGHLDRKPDGESWLAVLPRSYFSLTCAVPLQDLELADGTVDSPLKQKIRTHEGAPFQAVASQGALFEIPGALSVMDTGKADALAGLFSERATVVFFAPGNDMVKESGKGMHQILVGSGEGSSRAALLTVTPSGLMAKPLSDTLPEEPAVMNRFFSGVERGLIAIQGKTLPSLSLLIICVSFFALVFMLVPLKERTHD